MQLGKISIPRDQWPLLAGVLERELSGQTTLPEFGDKLITPAVRKTAEKAINHYCFYQYRKEESKQRKEQRQLKTIDFNTATTSWERSLGSELVGDYTYRKLQLPKILKECGFSARERSLAEAVVLGRLIKPGSDLGTWRWLRNSSSMNELTEVSLEKVKKDAIYEIADRLFKYKDPIEEHLFQREKKIFPDRGSLYLFDLTNLYFEGDALGNILAQYGKSKERRNDCPLVSLALVVDSHGFPVISRVYEGNIGEPKTLKKILEDLGFISEDRQLKLTGLLPTLVMDRGLATRENIDLIRGCGLPYIIIERSPRQKEYVDLFSGYKETFDRIERKSHKDVWVYKVEGPDEDTVRVLCVSEGRKLKENAIARRWEGRAIEDLNKLQKSVERGYVKAIDKVNQRLGRIRERYAGFGKRFSASIKATEDGTKATGIRWERLSAGTEENAPEDDPLHGCYVIETQHKEESGINIWKLYMTITRVEGAFRSIKTDLGTRPIYHQLGRRTAAHLFISVLAYHLLISIEYQLSLRGDKRRWSTIREVLGTHSRNTIIMTDEKDNIHHIRQSGQPEAIHLDIYKKLDIIDPLPRHQYVVGRRV
ncbi:MAG: IS1634 family transposase [Candidatus Auribacterota bacterium]|nr:IS1634 family transposase [Candidatus Auribacterota bacterium]